MLSPTYFSLKGLKITMKKYAQENKKKPFMR